MLTDSSTIYKYFVFIEKLTIISKFNSFRDNIVLMTRRLVVNRRSVFYCISVLIILMLGSLVYASDLPKHYEYVEETERDYSLKHLKPLHITNVRGDISVQGWSLDKLRIKLKKKVLTSSPILATRLLSTMDYRYTSDGAILEISSQYGKGLTIEERLKERGRSNVHLEIQVFAPSRLNLHLWAVDGQLSVKNWAGSADLRSRSGGVKVDQFKGEQISLICESCSARFSHVKGSVQSLTGKGISELSHVRGKRIYVETVDGAIQAKDVSGDQLYSSRSGLIQGDVLQGKVEFNAESSNISLERLDGFLSGYLEKGSVKAQVNRWAPKDQATIETVAASVELLLPVSFSANLDLWSKQGSIEVKYPVVPAGDTFASGPTQEARLLGRVRDGGELFRIFSEVGSISLRRADLDAQP